MVAVNKHMKLVGVGSTNPVKIQAVRVALGERLPKASVMGVEVASRGSAQPMSDEETKRGVYERAIGILHLTKADVGVGLEGGVFIEVDQVWNTVWCCVIDRTGRTEWANGSRFILPSKLGEQLMKGEEMGLVMETMTGIADIRKKMGMLGVVTDGWVTRESEYRHLVELAMGRLLSEWV